MIILMRSVEQIEKIVASLAINDTASGLRSDKIDHKLLWDKSRVLKMDKLLRG